MSATTDIETLARELWGPPTHSTPAEMRFGSHGSKSIKVREHTWYDHEAGEGGGYADLYEKVHGERPADASIVATYDYHDAGGKLAFQVVRKVPKKFVQRRSDGNGGWIWNLHGIKRVPYRLPELLAAAPHATVFICEGEKDCDNLRERGLIATTNPGGAGKWLPDMSECLRDRDVVILPDNDEAGEKHAADVLAKVRGIARSMRIVRLPNLPLKGDVSDWLAAGGTAEELEQIAVAAEPHATASEERAGARNDPKAPTPPELLRFVCPADLQFVPIPEREWIVQDWLPIGCTTANYGDGGVGKTLLTQQLMTACATETPWCGYAVLPCRSLGLFCEDDESELHRRQDRICDHLGISLGSLVDMRWISGIGRDNTLASFTSDGRMQVTPLFDALAMQAKDFGARLVVLDTAADLFAGNENDRGQVRRFIGLLNRLALEIKGAVVLNAHPSRSGLSSGDLDGGSTAWSNSVRSRWSLARPKADAGAEEHDTVERVLSRRKANYASIGDTIKLRWVNGALATVTAAGGITGAVRRAEAEAVFLDLLGRCTAQGVSLSHIKNASNFAPRLMARRPDAQGYTAAELDRAMTRLFADRRIRAEDYGRKGDARQRIAADQQGAP
jgi:RecA-family ATPase